MARWKREMNEISLITVKVSWDQLIYGKIYLIGWSRAAAVLIKPSEIV